MAGYIPHTPDHCPLDPGHVFAVQRALGLPATGGQVRQWWDPIARACDLPTVDDLQAPIDGPGINVLPAVIWNRAVDIANKRA